jgi:hypothetical protein
MENIFNTSNNPALSQRSAQQKLSIKDTTEVVCEKCNHNVFNLGILLRKVSPILTGTGKPSYLPIDNVAFYCVSCGHVNDEFIPSELKSGSIIT